MSYNVFELNQVPNNWGLVKIGDVVKFIGGSQPAKTEFSSTPFESCIRLVQIRDFKTDRYTTYIPRASARRFFSEEDIMIGRYGPPVFQILRGLSGAYNVALMKAEPSVKVDRNFLFYLLQSPPVQNFVIENSERTAGQTGVNLDLLNNVVIPLPPLEEQRRITVVLDKADRLRQLDRQLVAKYDQLTQSVFLDMFGDPVKNEKFPTVTARKFIRVIGGYAFKSEDFTDSGIPVVKIGTVNKGYFDLKACSFLSEECLHIYKKYIVKPWDILMTLTGTVGKDDYGNVEMANDVYDSYLLNQRVAKIEYNTDKVNPYFLLRILKHTSVKNELTKISRGVRQANISNEDILKLGLILPPLEAQNRFSEIVQSIESQKAKAKASLQKSEALFTALLQRAFRGELFAQGAESEETASGPVAAGAAQLNLF